MSTVERLAVEGPYNLSLSLQVSGGFSPDLAQDVPFFRTAVRVEEMPVLIEVQQVGRRDGSRMTADEVRRSVAPFEPYRGLAAFYLLAASQLELGAVLEGGQGFEPKRQNG